ncbi:MAG: DUF2804 family protein [Clostridia bacterium]|nr:DUF2804 family protein [Clostridia bacterium]
MLAFIWAINYIGGIKMHNYPSYISRKRRPVATPKRLIKNGKAVFGTFDAPFQTMNFLDCDKPLGKYAPSFANKFRLTVWEAFEIMLDEGVLISAVYNVGVAGFSIFVFFDKRSKKTYSWVNPTTGLNAKVAPNLIHSITELYTANSYLILNNQLQDGKCHGKGKAHNKKSGDIEFDLKITSLAPPSIVSMPLGDNKPLYSQKEFFSVEGYLKLNGETFTANKRSTAIVDDHKGFYPFKMHYDWLTTMGTTMIDGKEQYLGFNLTQNQTTSSEDYNENLLWLEGYSCPLPPVNFTHIANNKWAVKDDHDVVNLVFNIEDDFQMQVHLGIIDVDYKLPFGTLTGYIKDIEGNKYVLDGMYGVGEDRTQKL